MGERVAIRDLEQLQESEGQGRSPWVLTVAFVAMGGACVVFAAMALSGRTSSNEPKRQDPLAELVAQQQAGPAAGGPVKAEVAAKVVEAPAPTEITPNEVTFPELLSDSHRPTTAMAAVKGNKVAPSAGAIGAPGSASTGKVAVAPAHEAPRIEATPVLDEPPPATDRLAVVPLPAQHALQPSTIVTRPRDALTRAAAESVKIAHTGSAAPTGHEGGWQLQVSSFHTPAEAEAFAEQLRARGHKAYVTEAYISGRGKFYRVRVGPFASRQSAAAYRVGFEAKEHVVPFIVPPAGTPH